MPTPLLAAYFERRAELTRYLRARTGSAAEAEDLVQELYLKVAAVGDGEEIVNPGAYLYRLASNLMLDRLRQRRRSETRDRDYLDSHNVVVGGQGIADLAPADEAVAARQRLERLLAAVETLPPRTRDAFRLHKFEGLTHAETAARLGISRSAVEKHISSALAHLLGKVKP